MALEKSITLPGGGTADYHQFTMFVGKDMIKFVRASYKNADYRDENWPQADSGQTFFITDAAYIAELKKLMYEKAVAMVPGFADAVAIYEPDAVTLDKTSLELAPGDTFDLIATVTPKEAPDKSVAWTSSNLNVAEVSNGHVTIPADAEGMAQITVTTVKRKKIAVCTVTVKKQETE